MRCRSSYVLNTSSPEDRPRETQCCGFYPVLLSSYLILEIFWDITSVCVCVCVCVCVLISSSPSSYQVMLIARSFLTLTLSLSLSLAIRSLLSCPLDCIRCPHTADLCKSLLFGQPWCVYVCVPIRDHHLQVCPYFIINTQHVLFVLFVK